MNKVDLVRTTLEKVWQGEGEPSFPIDSKEHNLALRLFAEIADEFYPYETKAIKTFVKEYAGQFRYVCKSGFSFSIVEEAIAKAALAESLRRDVSRLNPMAYMMLHHKDAYSERGLEEQYGKAIERLEWMALFETCHHLEVTYSSKHLAAGYCLLWVIKRVGGCSFELPDLSSFNEETVCDVLSKMMQTGQQIGKPVQFIEFLLAAWDWTPLFRSLMLPDAQATFVRYTVDQFKERTEEEWPEQKEKLFDLLHVVTFESRLLIAAQLAESKVQDTARMGKVICSILDANFFREALPHLQELKVLYPALNDTISFHLFRYHFIKFYKEKKEHPLATSLNFKDPSVHGSLVIGTIGSSYGFEDLDDKPYLLAFDKKSEKMKWCMPLNPFDMNRDLSSVLYHVRMTEHFLAVYFNGENRVNCLHPETGEKLFELVLPDTIDDPYDTFHVGQNGRAYFVKTRKKKIFGGSVDKGVWVEKFQCECPTGICNRLSSHLGFDRLGDCWTVVGPQGDQIILNGCRELKAEGSQLFAIEQDPEEDSCSLLTQRSLIEGPEVVSTVEKTIRLKGKWIRFESLCHNNTMVLLDEHAVLFVDLNTAAVTYIKIASISFCSNLVNKETAELWTWTDRTKELYKISKEGIQPMGTLPGTRGLTLVHVDQDDRLYYIQPSY